MVTGFPRRWRGAAGRWARKGRRSHPVASRSVPPAQAAAGRRYSAALGSAASALPSTSSSEHSPVPFRAIRRGTTNGRSPRLGAEAKGQRAGQRSPGQLSHPRAVSGEAGHLASLREGPGGPPGDRAALREQVSTASASTQHAGKAPRKWARGNGGRHRDGWGHLLQNAALRSDLALNR